ncbi:hypothetical protein BC828DRAFT_387329 [Blastocladiella britannica]|nr:hypothetical protein BC828DRAFT_387329 [Blastocladiella britannica]
MTYNSASYTQGSWHIPPAPTAAMAVTSMVFNVLFTGALTMQLVWALCVHPRPRTRIEWAMHIAAACQLMSIVATTIGGVAPAGSAWPPPPSSLAGGKGSGNQRSLARTLSLAVVLVTQYIALALVMVISLRRARAVAVVAPRAAHRVVPALAFAVLLVTFVSRALNLLVTAVDLDDKLGSVSDGDVWVATSILWSVASQLAAAFVMVSEGYITSVIARCRKTTTGGYRERPVSRLASDAGIIARAAHAVLGRWPKSTSTRVRLYYSALICGMFLANAVLTFVGMFGTFRFAPFLMSGWSLVLIRIYEFRSELMAPVLPSAPTRPSTVPLLGAADPTARRDHQLLQLSPGRSTQASSSRIATSYLVRPCGVPGRFELLHVVPSLATPVPVIVNTHAMDVVAPQSRHSARSYRRRSDSSDDEDTNNVEEDAHGDATQLDDAGGGGGGYTRGLPASAPAIG